MSDNQNRIPSFDEVMKKGSPRIPSFEDIMGTPAVEKKSKVGGSAMASASVGTGEAGLLPLSVDQDKFQREKLRYEAANNPQMQLTEEEITNDPVKAAAKIINTKVNDRIMPKAAASSTAVQKPLELRYQEKPKEGLSLSDAKKEIEHINKNLFQSKEEAEQYLQQNIDKDENNLTKQLAVKRFQDFEKLELAINESNNLEEAAVKLAAINGDEQVKYLLNKAGGLGGMTEESSAIPLAMRGEKLLQLLMNRDFLRMADKNPALKTQVKEEMFNFPNRHPEYATKILAEMIANKRDEQGLNNAFANIVSKETTDKIVKELIESGDLPANYQFLYEKTIRPKLGTWQSIGRGIGNLIPGVNQLVNEAPIPTPGLLESIEGGLEKTEVGIAKSILDLPSLAGLPTLTDAIQSREQQTYNILKKQAETPAFEPTRLSQKIAMHGGNLATFVAGLSGGTSALRALNLIKNPAMANAAMMVLATHGDTSDQAKALFPRNDFKQFLYTDTMGILNAALGKYLPGQQIPRLLGQGKETVATVLKKMVDGDITTKAAKNQLLDWFSNTAKSTLHGAEFMGAISAADDSLTQLLEGKGFNFDQALESGWEGFKLGLIATPLLAGTEAALKSNKGFRSQIIDFAERPDYYKELARLEGEKDPEFAKVQQDIINNIDYVSEVYKEVADTKMSTSDKQKYVLDSLSEKIKLNKAENATDPTIKKRYQQEAKDLSEIKDAALSGIPEEKVKLNQAIRDVKELYNEDLISKGAKEMMESKEGEEGKPKFDEKKVKPFLKFLAQQANNIIVSPEGEKFDTGSDARKATEKQYPSQLIELANEMFPEYRKIAEEYEATIVTEPLEKPKEGTAENVVPSTLDWSKDVESTEKALDELDNANHKKVHDFFGSMADMGIDISRRRRQGWSESYFISDEYHKAKADGSNPELVKAVEDLLGQPKQISSQSNIETDAVSKQVSNEVDVRQQASYGEGVGKGDIQPQSTTTKEEGKGTGEEAGIGEPPKESKPLVGGDELSEGIGITHAQTEQIRKEFNIPEYDKKASTFPEWDAEAAERIKKGDLPKLLDKMNKGDEISPVEQRMMGMYIAHLDRKVSENSSDANLSELKKAIELSDRVGGSQIGKSLVARKGTFLPEDSLGGMMVAEMEAAGVDKLTEKQKEAVKKEYDDLQKAKDEFNAYMEKREAEFNAKKAEAEFNKAKTTAKKTKKTHEDFVTERKSLKEELSAARKEHEDWLKEQGIKKSGFGSLTVKEAKVITKIVKSYLDEGITKFQEVVEKVYEEVRNILPNVNHEDIKDVIAGKYNEKKDTRNELAAKMFSLKQQQKITEQLEKLVKEPEPDSETGKIKRNKQIADLKKQLTDFESLNKEERELVKELEAAKKEISKQVSPQVQALENRKVNLRRQIDEIQDKINKGDFAPPKKKETVRLDTEGQKLRDKLIKLQQQRDARMMLLQRQKETGRERSMRLVAEVFNIPRTLMTIGDFSGLLRQNLFFSAGHPIMTAKATPDMFKSFVKPEVYDRWFTDLKETPRYSTIKESGVAIADALSHDLSKREEAFMSSLAEKIPLGVGKIVKGSERSYTMLLNKMRVDVFNYLADKMEARGMTIENSPKQYKAMAEYINNATGRSDFGERLNRIAPILNATFFSPRLIASRINMLTYWAQPRFWKTLPREARIDYFRNWASLLAVGGTILALAKLAGADVEDDPRSSDFGKIKSGNTRWDIWGGAQPYVRALTQMFTGERKSTRTGKIYELNGDDIFGETRGGVALDFFRNKLAPVPGAAVDVLSGRTGIGERIIYEWGGAGDKEISIDQYVKQRLLPMTITGTEEAIKDRGWKALFDVGIPSTFGIGTQTYGTPPSGSPTKQSKQGKSTEKKQTKAD